MSRRLRAEAPCRLRSILITSPNPGEGKSTVALDLAMEHAKHGYKTLLIDASLERPSLHRLIGLQLEPGLSEVLVGKIEWRETVRRIQRVPELSILPAGAFSYRATDKLGRRIVDLLLDAYSTYDFVIIDAPALATSVDSLQLATMVHGVVVIARAGHSRTQQIRSALEVLDRVRANTLGLVLNACHVAMIGQDTDAYAAETDTVTTLAPTHLLTFARDGNTGTLT